MPYNTRRKSLSLPSLGIQLPHGSRAHRPSPSKASAPAESQPPPTKKVKRSHSSNLSPIFSARPRSTSTKNVSFAERPKSSGRTTYDHTPPPSPGANGRIKIDTEGIKDEIVVGVIDQLEKTGNRPHLIKELATVLSVTNDAVLRYFNADILRVAGYCWISLTSSVAPQIHRRCCPPVCRLTFAVLTGLLYLLARWPKNLFPSTRVKSSTTLLQCHGKIFLRILRIYYHHMSSTVLDPVEKEVIG